MQTLEQTTPKTFVEIKRSFSLPLYLLLVYGLSWPFQIAYALSDIGLLPNIMIFYLTTVIPV